MSDLVIQELQIKQTYLERHVEEQDRVIYALRSELDKLKQEIARLGERVKDSREGTTNLPADEKPPHY